MTNEEMDAMTNEEMDAMTNEEMDAMEHNPFTEPVIFRIKANTTIKGWNGDSDFFGRFNGTYLETIVEVRAVDAEDTGYVCNIKPNEYVDFGGILYPAHKLCELLECSIHKLGNLFHDSVQGEVYQHLIDRRTPCPHYVDNQGYCHQCGILMDETAARESGYFHEVE